MLAAYSLSRIFARTICLRAWMLKICDVRGFCACASVLQARTDADRRAGRVFVRNSVQSGRICLPEMSYVQKGHKGPEWTNELALQLIREYEKFPLLWDAKNPLHFSKNKKADAWAAISLNVRMDVPHCIQKMNSLLGSFRREKKRGKKSIGTGKARKEIYVSKWYAFERMRYLLDKNKPRTTMDTEKKDNEDQELIDSDQTSSNLKPERNALDGVDKNLNRDGLAVVETESFTAPVQTPSQKKRKASDKKDDARLEARLEERFKILQESAAMKEMTPDYCTPYSQYVANKLRGYSIRTRAQVENAINNILFHADMGKYDHNQPFPNSSPHD